MLWTGRNIFALAGAGMILASCGMVDGRRDTRLPAPRKPVRQAVSDMPVKIGAPYIVRGVTYTPSDDRDYDAVGYASWYGAELRGNRTANGERFDPDGITAAHPTLPLPSYVEVTAIETGRTILVRINDRGPFSGGRLLDLSQGAAEQLDLNAAAPVRVRRVEPAEAERALLRAGRRAPLRNAAESARRAPSRLVSDAPPLRFGSVPPAASPPRGRNGYIVQIASFASHPRAEELADRIGAHLTPAGAVWRVLYGPFDTAADAQAAVKRAASKGFRDARIMAND